jgi:hypothetical protein
MRANERLAGRAYSAGELSTRRDHAKVAAAEPVGVALASSSDCRGALATVNRLTPSRGIRMESAPRAPRRAPCNVPEAK